MMERRSGKADILNEDHEGNSLWRATATAASDTPPLQGDATADVAIVGAGYTGLSAALHLAEAGIDVALLDRHAPGWGASGRNGGMVIPGLKEDPDELLAKYGREDGEALIRTSAQTADLVFDLIDRFDIQCDARRAGWIQAAHTARQLPILEHRYEQWAARDADVEWLPRTDMAARVGSDMYHGGWIDRRAGGLQPLSYARGLARAAQSLGARIHGDSPVEDLAADSDGWRITTPNGQLRARSVILATNGYTQGLWPGLPQSVVPVLSVQVATAPLSENVRRLVLGQGEMLSDTRRVLWYFRQDAHGRLLMGGGGTAYASGADKVFTALQDRVRTLLPQVSDLSFEYAWHGRVALTTDHLPHLHELAPNLWAGLGYNGRGVAMATMMGKLLADRVRAVDAPELRFPTLPLRPLPLHGFRGLAISAVRRYYNFRDSLEA